MNRALVGANRPRLEQLAQDIPVKAQQWGTIYGAPDVSVQEFIQVVCLQKEKIDELSERETTAEGELTSQLAEQRDEITRLKRQLNTSKARETKLKNEKAALQKEISGREMAAAETNPAEVVDLHD